MGTRTSEQERMAGKSAPKTGGDTTMVKSFSANNKVVVAPYDCPACHFHGAQEAAVEDDKE